MSANYTPQLDMGHLYRQRLGRIITGVPRDILGRVVSGNFNPISQQSFTRTLQILYLRALALS